MKAAAVALCSALFCAVCACAGAPAPITAPAPTTAAASAPPASCGGSVPSYQREVAPLLRHYCLGCHAPGGEAGEDHDFTRHAVLSAQRRQLWGELETESMPPQDRPQPSPAERALLERWACFGAPNDEAARAGSVSGADAPVTLLSERSEPTLAFDEEGSRSFAEAVARG